VEKLWASHKQQFNDLVVNMEVVVEKQSAPQIAGIQKKETKTKKKKRSGRPAWKKLEQCRGIPQRRPAGVW
jgi:hypothetical protein